MTNIVKIQKKKINVKKNHFYLTYPTIPFRHTIPDIPIEILFKFGFLNIHLCSVFYNLLLL